MLKVREYEIIFQNNTVIELFYTRNMSPTFHLNSYANIFSSPHGQTHRKCQCYSVCTDSTLTDIVIFSTFKVLC